MFADTAYAMGGLGGGNETAGGNISFIVMMAALFGIFYFLMIRPQQKKQKELIALGISIYSNCESCMEWHIRGALNSGSSRDEIIETIGVSMEMGGGPATVASRFAMNVLEYYFNK